MIQLSGSRNHDSSSELEEISKQGDKPALGLRINLSQFILFSILTLWIGWFLGIERVVVPVMGANIFHISSFLLIISFIAVFGFTKAILDVVAGRWSDKLSRKPILILGGLLAFRFLSF